MTRLIVLLAMALVLAPVAALVRASGVADALFSGPEPVEVPARLAGAPGTARTSPPEPAAPRFRQPEEDSLYALAARTAWRYVASQTHPDTGIPNSVIGYPYATVWDLASAIAGIHSAHGLGIIDRAEHDARMTAALRTLGSLPLFDGAALNKNYQIARGTPAGRDDRERPARRDGYGWSALDMGRLLVWLKIVERSSPPHAEAARAIVGRFDLDRLVADGYLRGVSVGPDGRVRGYQEGRLGYEQYAAAGFALWGVEVDRALSWRANARPVDVLGVTLEVDRRESGHLTSEPFLLIGIELGWWTPGWRTQAEAVLRAQEARYRQTGQITMATEDALPVGPYHFYYYTIHDEEPFAVRALGPQVPSPAPRWVSTKAAFAWYAIFPGPYPWEALRHVERGARDAELGWHSGLYEGTDRPTGGQNINTAAVVLEAALYRERRRPLMEP